MPRIGKHTIAKALEEQLCGVGRIVHNHQHIDLVGALLPRSSLQYQQARRDVRAVIFNSLATLPDTFKYIFTDFQTDNKFGRSVVEEYKTAAQSRQCDFFPIVLTCDRKTNAQRIRSTERLDLVNSDKGMLVDASVLEKKMRDDGSIFKADCPEILELDVTTLSPHEAASKILEHMESILKQKFGG
ncbi:hypothetical protein DL95DRAFT_464289 [Leptodontidium sp. 2 PMI_412]|nr:hypothetical protein DL95DRAFT_464289 [Leptodontidium sp. 2 PMI_412]